ncbi:DUF397 domain-containing protein [Actinoplanes sp. NPDC048796]|uniref:DUF397 domain-containing protein n=1 Tax=unclassified Actinoplanes TaxID=2626549 RepID=UPI0033E61B4D
MAELEKGPSGWKKSSRSAQGNCVEVNLGDEIKIRDTKDRAGAVLSVSPEAWTEFLDGVRRGEFDVR